MPKKNKNQRKQLVIKPSRFERSAYWKAELQKARNPYTLLYQIKAEMPLSLTEEILAWLHRSNPRLAQRILGTEFPRTSSAWSSVPVAKAANYDREVRWCCLRLRPNVTVIAEFVEMTRCYEKLFVHGDFIGCLSLLDSAEAQFGLSLWLVKRRIHTLQLARGLEDQKTYSAGLKDDPVLKDTLIPYLLYYVSYRAEASVNTKRFEAQYQASLLDFPISKSLRFYLLYHINSQYCGEEDAIAGILNYESSGPLIDYYEALVATAQMCAATNDLTVGDGTLNALYMLGKATKDDRLFRIVTRLGGELDMEALSIISEDSMVFEAFAAGENERVLSVFHQLLEKSERIIPGDLLLFVLASLDPSTDTSWQTDFSKHPMAQQLRKMLLGEGAIKSARDALCRFAWALDGSATSYFLRSAIRGEINPASDASDSADLRYYLIGIGKDHPIQSWWSPSFQKMSEIPYSVKETTACRGPSCQYTCDFCLGKAYEHIEKDYNSWECARQLIRKCSYAESLTYAQSLTLSANPFYRKQSVLLTVWCFLELGEIQKCIEVVTDYLLVHPHSSEFMPLIRLMAAVTPQMRLMLAGNIYYPILCHMFTIATDGNEPFLRSYAAEDFLGNIGLSRPSQLKVFFDKIPYEKLIFFLHEICVEQVMDTWIEFESSEDVALERVEVCKLLTDLNPKNNEVYQREIRDIMRRITIRKRITEVEQSRIYVDTESVKEAAKRTLFEDYQRYLTFRSSGMTVEHKEVIESAQKSLANGNLKEFLSLKFPRNEMSALLEKMVVHLRDEFVASSQHGLDGYLSVRIRHGTLEGQMRSAFEAESLLTKKCSETKEYAQNQHWLDRFDFSNSSDTEAVADAFREFSAQFDQLVHNIKKDWIQIKKKSDDTGRIDFTLLSPEIDIIATYITEGTSLDQFIDLVLDYFVSSKLDPSLKNMRKGIQAEIKPRLNELLTQLQSSIEERSPVGRTHELRSAIGRARTSGQNTLDRIAGWLRLAKTEKKEPFLLDEVISISEASIKASCPEFSVIRNIDAELGELRIQASLPSFVDVVCLIFDNIVRHSGVVICTQGVVTALYETPYLRIHVENEVAVDSAADAQRQHVKEIKEGIMIQPFSQSVSKEGGTGFIKIQKILHHDFRLPSGQVSPALDFGFADKNKFYVEVKIPIHSIKSVEVEE